MTKDRILVTGAGGFLGGHMVKSLLAQGKKVIATDQKDYTGWLQTFDECRDSGQLRVDEGRNLRLMLPMSLFIDCDTMYHFAASTGGIEFKQRKHLTAALNAAIDLNVFGMAGRSGVSKVVYPINVSRNPTPITNGHELYKNFSAKLCEYYSNDFKGLSIKAIETPRTFGPHDLVGGHRESCVIALCRKHALAKMFSRKWEIWGTGLEAVELNYVDSVIASLQQEVGSAETYSVTISQLADMIEEVAKCSLERLYLPNAPHISDNSPAYSSEISKEFIQGLENTYNWVLTKIR